MSTKRFTNQQIDRLLGPKSVAVVGASDRHGALGATLLNNLVQYEFPGEIYPVNPKRDEIAGLKCYPTVDELPEGIDCAVLAIPRPFVLDTVRRLAARGCGAVVIYSAGFSEAGEEGMRDQLELGAIAAEHGMVIEGPNCLGLHQLRRPRAAELRRNQHATAAQGRRARSASPASRARSPRCWRPRSIRAAATSRPRSRPATRRPRASRTMSNGWSTTQNTHVIAMYVESLRRPQAFIAAARRARAAGKPIVMLHPGKSNKAQESAATHTGAMAGDYALMKAKLAREGVIFADTLEELADITEIALRCKALPGANMAVLGESGALRGLAYRHRRG